MVTVTKIKTKLFLMVMKIFTFEDGHNIIAGVYHSSTAFRFMGRTEPTSFTSVGPNFAESVSIYYYDRMSTL